MVTLLDDPKETFPRISTGPIESPTVLFGKVKLPLTVPPSPALLFQSGIIISGSASVGAPVNVAPLTVMPASIDMVVVAFPFIVLGPLLLVFSISSFDLTLPFTVTLFAKTTSSLPLEVPPACKARPSGNNTLSGRQENPVSKLKKFTVSVVPSPTTTFSDVGLIGCHPSRSSSTTL